VSIAGAAIAGIGTGASIYQGAKAQKAQKKANAAAQKDAAETKAANERANNAANQKSPNLLAIMAGNKQAMSGGVGSTSLTGPKAPSLSPSLLGRATLLGG
jgi:hypothetical protein